MPDENERSRWTREIPDKVWATWIGVVCALGLGWLILAAVFGLPEWLASAVIAGVAIAVGLRLFGGDS